MPSSPPAGIEVIVEIVWRLAPRSIVDLGTGYGKYGVLFREYLELKHRYALGFADAERREVRIDGVEGFPDYLGPLQRAVYDHIYVEDILEFTRRGQHYDLVFLGDVLEHFEKNAAMLSLIPALLSISDMG